MNQTLNFDLENSHAPLKDVVLVIGYGNTLRGDDGVGQWVAEMIELWQEEENLENLRSHSYHQLTPELAADLANTQTVIFVDACVGETLSQTVTVEALEVEELDTLRLGHDVTVRSLLTLTLTLYKTCPQAWLVSIPGFNFELGETFSPQTQQNATIALAEVKRLIHSSPVVPYARS